MTTRGKASGGKSRSTKPKSAKAGTGAKPVASDPVLGPLSRYKFGGLVTEAKPVAFLGGHSCRFVLQDFEEDPQPDEFRAAVRNALDAKPAILKAAEPHVVQYCTDALARYDDDDRPALVLEKPGDVWSHVQFGDEFIVRRRTAGEAEHGVYLSLTCNCDWDAEHQGQWIRFARYEYDDKGRLVRVTDADDFAWTYAYDEHNRLVRDTDRAGLSFCFRYDEKDRGIEAWGEYVGKRDPSLADDVPKFLADGRTRAKGIYHRKFDYHADGYTEVTDTTETRRFFGNRKGMLSKAVTGGAVTSSKYDARGFEIEKTDPMGATTRWVRDERGRILEVINPLQRRTQIQRDPSGAPVQVIDAAGGVLRMNRDQRGNLEQLLDPAGGTTQFAFDERGLWTSTTDPIGVTTQYAYDTQGNLVGFVQPNGARWVLAYDPFGRRVSERDPTGAETRYVYSNRGDLVAVHDAVGGVTRFAYDGEGHVTQIMNPQGHATQLTWGGFHKLCARRDANGHVVRLAYSREGELLEVHNEREEIHRFYYDNAGQLVEERTFDGRTLLYRHDAADRLVRFVNGAGEVTTITYDEAGQAVARELPDDTKETYEYNERGELVRATNAAGQFQFRRDALGRIVREAQKVGDEEHWIETAYDQAGNQVRRATSLGHTEAVQRDVMGARTRTLLGREHSIEHANDILAREVNRKLPGGGTVESGFDPMGRLIQRLVRSPFGARAVGPDEPEWMGRRDDGVNISTSYQYGADGELVAKQDRARGATRYEYDPVGQLLAAIPEKARAEVFRYDPAGNVHTATGDDPERVYAEGNRLVRNGDTEYEWDADGRLSRKTKRTPEGERVWTYAWNGAGLLETVGTPDGRVVQFGYDPFARRVEKQVREREGLAWRVIQRSRFVWDQNSLAHEIRRRDEERDPVIDEKTFVFDDDGFVPLAHGDRVKGATGDAAWFHYVNDASGAPDRLIDEDGAIACELTRKVWGEGHAEPGARTETAIRL